MRRALGKGLSQLIADQFESNPTEVSIDSISPNARQPRTIFNEEAIQDLANSIRQFGILQPIVVRPQAEGTYEIIAGERRWRAARVAGLETVPILIKSAANETVLELALIENIQREDINALECARAYRRLIDEFGLTQEQVAEKVGKSRVTVANAVRLLRLPKRVQDGIDSGAISEGHARALLAFEGEDRQLAVFDMILARNLNVRDVERLAQNEPKKQGTKEKEKLDPNMDHLQRSLATFLSAPVRLEPSKKGGKLTIDYSSDDDLQRILDQLGFSL